MSRVSQRAERVMLLTVRVKATLGPSSGGDDGGLLDLLALRVLVDVVRGVGLRFAPRRPTMT